MKRSVEPYISMLSITEGVLRTSQSQLLELPSPRFFHITTLASWTTARCDKQQYTTVHIMVFACFLLTVATVASQLAYFCWLPTRYRSKASKKDQRKFLIVVRSRLCNWSLLSGQYTQLRTRENIITIPFSYSSNIHDIIREKFWIQVLTVQLFMVVEAQQLKRSFFVQARFRIPQPRLCYFFRQ